jgi:hypothetical protein
LAAREAGVATVSVYVRPGTDGDENAQAVDRVAEPIVENDQCQALTDAQRAKGIQQAHVITTIFGQPVKHRDMGRQAWIQASIAAAVPADYSDMLALLTETVASNDGSRPTNDVEHVTGVPPTSFADFVRRTTHQFGRAQK